MTDKIQNTPEFRAELVEAVYKALKGVIPLCGDVAVTIDEKDKDNLSITGDAHIIMPPIEDFKTITIELPDRPPDLDEVIADYLGITVDRLFLTCDIRHQEVEICLADCHPLTRAQHEELQTVLDEWGDVGRKIHLYSRLAAPCPDCGGTGQIALLTTTVPCVCQGPR